LDGLRRWNNARRENIHLSKKAKRADKQLSKEQKADSTSEFPSGGARSRIPEQVALKLDEPVPLLMESVQAESIVSRRQLEPSLGSAHDFGDQNRAYGSESYGNEPYGNESYGNTSYGDAPYDEQPQAGQHAHNGHAYENYEGHPSDVQVSEHEEHAVPQQYEAETEAPTAAASAAQDRAESYDQEEHLEPEEVLIFNVMAHKGQYFFGPDMMCVLMDYNMKFGDMGIFHRHENDDGSGPVLFSMANMVVPGSFNLSAMNEFYTPGLSLFLSLPLPQSLEEISDSVALDVYNLMARTAQGLAKALDGELKDENRSVMTLQTIEHGRQRVIEYQRKRKLSKTGNRAKV